jgi:hypothetical protein
MRSIISTRSHLAFLGIPLLATACVSTQLEPSGDHPANAKAAIPPVQLASIRASAPASAGADTTASDPDHATPMADTYTCPMHPQIVRDAPGKCPICGMTLVKKESPSPHGTAH